VASKGISIKIYRVKLLTALKDKLKEVESNQALFEAAVKTHESNCKDYQEAIKKIAIKNLDSITEVVQSRWKSDDDFTVFEMTVKVDKTKLPTEPEEPTPPYKGGRGYGRNYVSNDYQDIVAEMTNAIRMLELSDEEVISTATYASVAKYL
jgi:hypothetical protein